ncbi:MAG: hypothetical protein M0042_02170 [Nitrospiraceae bacterium]|nr:hypothetical protein [Nitrospiraceae bacterium]
MTKKDFLFALALLGLALALGTFVDHFGRKPVLIRENSSAPALNLDPGSRPRNP